MSAQHTASIGQNSIPCRSNLLASRHRKGQIRTSTVRALQCVLHRRYHATVIKCQGSKSAAAKRSVHRGSAATRLDRPARNRVRWRTPESPAGSKPAQHAARFGRPVENDGRAGQGQIARCCGEANKSVASDGRQRDRIPTAIPSDGHCDAGGWKLLAEDDAKLSGMRSKPGAQ